MCDLLCLAGLFHYDQILANNLEIHVCQITVFF